MTKPKEWVKFAITATVEGEYEVSDGMVTVRSAYGQKFTQLGGSTGDQLAQLLLGEMVRDPSSADPPT